MFDQSTEFGQRVARRLAEERIIWLTTVDQHDVPQPRPVWFWWDGEDYSHWWNPGANEWVELTQDRA